MGFQDRISRGNGSIMGRFGDYQAQVGFSDPVPVLYDAPFKKEALYEGQVETSAPACSMLDADAERLCIAHGVALTILVNGTPIGDFTVEGIEPDGLGLTRLQLTKDN